MISANPKTTYPHVLACDRNEPRSRQCRWFLKNLTAAEWEEYGKPGEGGGEKREGRGERGAAEIAAELWAALRLIVAGWQGPADAEGNPIPYAPDRLEEALTFAEAWELYYAGLTRLELSGEDRKNSGSRRPSASAASAVTAADAPTAAANPTR